MPQYGVWLDQGYAGSETAMKLDPGELPPDLPERSAMQLAWRGTADNRVEAVRAARAEWERQHGPKALAGRCYVEEILPGDSGYRAD
jgi:hypothetical protein